jgi:hypothetical protein
MPRRVLPCLLAITLLLGARRAHADHEGEIGAVVVVTAGAATLDVVLAIRDVVADDNSRSYGAFEALFLLPQVATTGALTVWTAVENPDHLAPAILAFAFTTALFVHGLHEATERDEPREMSDVVPMAVSDGTHVGGGVGVVGRW